MKTTRARTRRWEDVEKGSVELRELARHFELYNRTEGKSQKTVDWYNMTLRQFHAFLVARRKPTRLSSLGEVEVREFILHLQQRRRYQDNPYILGQRGRLAAISVQTYVRALRAFFNWLYREGYTKENRLANLKPPKAPTKVVEVLSQEEIARVLACIDRNTAGGARDYAIILLLLDSGLRCSELTGMEVNDVNLEGGYLKVMGKRGKERIVPFGASAQRALLRYLLHFRPEPFNLAGC